MRLHYCLFKKPEQLLNVRLCFKTIELRLLRTSNARKYREKGIILYSFMEVPGTAHSLKQRMGRDGRKKGPKGSPLLYKKGSKRAPIITRSRETTMEGGQTGQTGLEGSPAQHSIWVPMPRFLRCHHVDSHLPCPKCGIQHQIERWTGVSVSQGTLLPNKH
jgi:hypothetical protein